MTVIHIGEAPKAFTGVGLYADGETAALRAVSLEIQDGSLIIAEGDVSVAKWPLADMRRLRDQADKDAQLFAWTGDDLARLEVTDAETLRALLPRCEKLDKGHPVKNKRRIFGWGLSAVASVFLIIFVLVPVMADQMAEFLPPEGEKALGDATFEQIKEALSYDTLIPVDICESQEGNDALNAMLARLTDGLELPYPVQADVLNHDMVNAFALPGGRVVLFRGLLEAADGPDEVAAVLAHEIGHVSNRDATRGALRSAGSIGVLGLLFGDFAGGALVLFLAEQLIDAQYSQDVEANADVFAQQLLIERGISPAALADFFEALREEYGDEPGILVHFLSHPELGDRIEASRRAAEQMTGTTSPSLDDSQWKALQDVCRNEWRSNW